MNNGWLGYFTESDFGTTITFNSLKQRGYLPLNEIYRQITPVRRDSLLTSSIFDSP
ncbi:hypothetical protein [Carboxylicivirga sp. N1Y90]|uniref:hypothetical protein n=1 Tax=Carboxylicivirga fragile TaxID=3417571 RepID=UPI003D342066|nr:hypothetical protein [Marinilabiliaceae bacterium N1Y90]